MQIKIKKLANETCSCVKFIGKLLLASFPKNYFLTHGWNDITESHLEELYGLYSHIILLA